MAVDVAVLYVDPRGPYPKMEGVDWYDAERNAEMFPGGMPVVAHPPCGPWGKLSHMYKGGEGGPEGAMHAVELVRECGGVLEHPAHSRLWDAMDLPEPGDPPDQFGGYTIEVEQVRFGHPAVKRTWLYCVGVPQSALEHPEPRRATHWISGGRGRPGEYASQCARAAGFKVCSEKQRAVTPPDFARYLVKLARSVKR